MNLSVTNKISLLIVLCLLTPFCIKAAQSIPQSTLTIDVAEQKAEISPTMYGLFFEDINRSADGGMYAEMIFNRGFEERNLPSSCTYDPVTKRVYAPHKAVYSSPEHKRSWSIEWDLEDKHPGWSIETDRNTVYQMHVGETFPKKVEGSKSMYIDIESISAPLKLVNTGFYGLAVEKGKKYDLVFYLRTDVEYNGNVTAQILTSDNKVIGSHKFQVISDGGWNRYETELTAQTTMNDGKFALEFDSKGSLAVDYVSLFPQETFMNRKNGFRKDVIEVIADLEPAFMRWPGGCIVEGLTMENRVKWKNTIGAPEERKGEYNLWGYYSTNGFGYHEFLQLCEDLDMESMFVCNAGMSCDARNGDFYDETEIDELIQEALDAIEYAVGSADSKWGAERAKNGHKEPFGLDYIEIGNENHSPIYAKYYDMFYDRIRAEYPDLTIITCLPMSDQLEWIKDFDLNDPHFYNFPSWYYKNTDYFDNYAREDYKVYVGEYACNMGVGSGNMEGALSEGAFILGMERNSDLVTMTSYAPLMENTKCRMGVNLILVENDDVIGRTSYHVERLFSTNRPDVNLATDLELGILPDKTSPKGGIGLGTYKTSAEYSNIRVTVDGKVMYRSDKRSNPKKWKADGKEWQFEDGKIIQSDPAGTEKIMLTDSYYDSKNMTVEFDAVKRGGEEGFVFIFGADDPHNCYQLTLGSFGNRWTIFQSLKNGNAFVLNQERPEFPIEVGRTYKVKLVIDGDNFECWVDGKKSIVWDNTYIQRQYAISGFKRDSKEVIVKVINAEDVPMNTTLNLKNGAFKSIGTITTLAADSKYDENTFEDRYKVYPKEETLTNVSNTMNMEFKPQSMTVIRLQLK